jgi:hypothetical protein
LSSMISSMVFLRVHDRSAMEMLERQFK